MPIDPTQDAALAALAAGAVVGGRYTLIEVAGLGGMGVVWRAHDRLSASDVALKFLPRIITCDGVAARELRREAERACRLVHAHICRVYDFGEDEARGLAWISMDYMPGGTLADRLGATPRGFFEPDEIAAWTQQLCEALEYAHDQAGIVHRDLKPANLLLDAAGKVQITDFGIAGTLCESFTRITGSAPHKTGTTGSGTPLYMSPQQARGGRPRATDDLYALGATLFELLTGRAPFYEGDVSWQRMHVPPPRVSERREELKLSGAAIPDHWEITLLRLLAKQPEHRPQSAHETAAALRGVPAGPPPRSSISTIRPKTSIPPAAASAVQVPAPPPAQPLPPSPAAPTEPASPPRPRVPTSIPPLPPMDTAYALPKPTPPPSIRSDPWFWALIVLTLLAIVLAILVVFFLAR